jgi:hypothetical protein
MAPLTAPIICLQWRYISHTNKDWILIYYRQFLKGKKNTKINLILCRCLKIDPTGQRTWANLRHALPAHTPRHNLEYQAETEFHHFPSWQRMSPPLWIQQRVCSKFIRRSLPRLTGGDGGRKRNPTWYTSPRGKGIGSMAQYEDVVSMAGRHDVFARALNIAHWMESPCDS